MGGAATAIAIGLNLNGVAAEVDVQARPSLPERSDIGAVDLDDVVLDLTSAQHVDLAAGRLIERTRRHARSHFEEFRIIVAAAEWQRTLEVSGDVD